MKKLIIIFFWSVCLSNTAWAHKEPTTGHNTLLNRQSEVLSSYNSFMIDVGGNFLQNCPDEFKAKSFYNHVLNGAVLHHIRIAKTPCTVGFGLGIGSERYAFSEKEDANYYMLSNSIQGKSSQFSTTKELIADSKSTYAGLFLRYLDIIVEARFNSNLVYPKDGAFIALGGFFSPLLISPSQTICCESFERRTNNTFNLNTTRYGVHARLGWNRVSIFYAVTLSSIFDKDGPVVNATPHKIGISLDLF